MNCHSLKTWVKPFGATWVGNKSYEVRTDDRGFEVNDCLHLREYDEEAQRYTGRSMLTRITYISRGMTETPKDVCVLATRILHWAQHPAEVLWDADLREYYFSDE